MAANAEMVTTGSSSVRALRALWAPLVKVSFVLCRAEFFVLLNSKLLWLQLPTIASTNHAKMVVRVKVTETAFNACALVNGPVLFAKVFRKRGAFKYQSPFPVIFRASRS